LIVAGLNFNFSAAYQSVCYTVVLGNIEIKYTLLNKPLLALDGAGKILYSNRVYVDRERR
jgi:hypothetical protein